MVSSSSGLNLSTSVATDGKDDFEGENSNAIVFPSSPTVNENDQRNLSVRNPTPSQFAWLALQRRLLNNSLITSTKSSEEEVTTKSQPSVEPFVVRIKRLKYFKKGHTKPDRKAARVTKGLPKHIWSSVLHKSRCQFLGPNGQSCTVLPKFGDAAVGIALVCKRHKSTEQVDVRSPLCAYPGCAKHPVFGMRAGGAPLFCKTHRQEGFATDCMNRQCSFVEGCRRQASYGEWGSKVPLFCREHKASAHINLRKPWCIGAPGCRTQPSFGPRGGAALYCAAHRVAGHINLVSRLCQHPDGCSRIPSFGEESDGVVKFCSAHRARYAAALPSGRPLDPPAVDSLRIGVVAQPRAPPCVMRALAVRFRLGSGNGRNKLFCV